MSLKKAGISNAIACSLVGCEPSAGKMVAQACRVRWRGAEEKIGRDGVDEIIERIDALERQALMGSDKAMAELGSFLDACEAIDEMVAEFHALNN